jgi:hypothetical protein
MSQGRYQREIRWQEEPRRSSQREDDWSTYLAVPEAPEGDGKLEVLQLARVTINPSLPYIRQRTASVLMLLKRLQNTSTKALQYTMILHMSVLSLQSNAQNRETFMFGTLTSSVNMPGVGSDQ